MNVITQSGNIGQDCETRVTPNGKTISAFSLATSSGWGDNKVTTWVTCKMFGERWNNIAPFLKKGSKVCVTGSFTVEKWEKDGATQSKVVILVNDVDLPIRNDSNHQPSQAQQMQQQRQQQPQRQPAQQFKEPDFGYDDSIPF